MVSVCLFIYRDIEYNEIDLRLAMTQVVAAEFKYFILINCYNPNNIFTCEIL